MFCSWLPVADAATYGWYSGSAVITVSSTLRIHCVISLGWKGCGRDREQFGWSSAVLCVTHVWWLKWKKEGSSDLLCLTLWCSMDLVIWHKSCYKTVDILKFSKAFCWHCHETGFCFRNRPTTYVDLRERERERERETKIVLTVRGSSLATYKRKKIEKRFHTTW